MFKKKIRIYLNDEEKRILVRSLIELRNDLIRQGKYDLTVVFIPLVNLA